MPINSTHAEYNADTMRMCRDAIAGERAVHAAGTKYLPKLAEETDTDYAARLKRTPFFNATYRTIAGLVGMLFRKPPRIEAPDTGDIDGAGAPLDTLLMRLATECLSVGMTGVMVDYSADVPVGATLAEVEALGARPTLALYKRESILDWRHSRGVLTMVKLAESHPVPGKDEWEMGSETLYRVLDLTPAGYRQRVYRLNPVSKKEEQIGGDKYPQMNGAVMRDIPFEFVGDDDEPPLIDLVTMNLHHYGVSADYEHGCHFSGLPTMYAAGAQDGTKIYIGGPSANIFNNPAGKLAYAEVMSNFGALRTNLEDKKSMMAVLGARMLETQRDGVEAAETAAQHRKGEESQLAGVAQSISRSMAKVMQWYADWRRWTGEVVVEINRDFLPMRMTPQELTALVGSWQSGAISGVTLHQNLQRGEIVAPDVSYEEEQARIGDAAPRV